MRRPGEQKSGRIREKRENGRITYTAMSTFLRFLLFEIRSLVKAASSLIFLKRVPYTKLVLKLLEERLFQMGCKGMIYKDRKVYKLNNKP